MIRATRSRTMDTTAPATKRASSRCPSACGVWRKSVSIRLNTRSTGCPCTRHGRTKWTSNCFRPKVRSLHCNNAQKQCLFAVLMHMFTYLDEISLWAIGQVCSRWREILFMFVKPERWHDFVAMRWPLLGVNRGVECFFREQDWYEVRWKENDL